VEVGDTCGWRLSMKMLLESSDPGRLEPVAKRLVASGIPIAVCRASRNWSCVEVWIQRDEDFPLARRALAGGVLPPAATQAPARGIFPDGRQRARESGKGGAKMLLASKDVVVLEPVAKELVASGIPIAVCKACDMSSYVEVWIQRDGECWAGPKLVVRGAVPGSARRAAASRLWSGRTQRGGARRRDAWVASSRIGRCVGWLLQLKWS